MIEVIINADGRTCSTVNPYPKPNRDEFNSESHNFYLMFLKIWEKAESERRTFEIEERWVVIGHNGTHNEWAQILYQPGTKHEAEIVNGKAVIK